MSIYVDKIWTFFTPLTRSIPDQSNLSLSQFTPLLIHAKYALLTPHY